MTKRRPKTFAQRRQERKNRLAEKKERARDANFINWQMSNSFEFEIESLSTPFGAIQTVETDLFNTITDQDLFIELMNFSLEWEDDEDMTEADNLAFFRNAAKRYPNEPLVFFELGKSYFDLKKIQKFHQQTKDNYARFKGFPMIDITYVDLLDKEVKIKFFKEEFGENLYLPDVYPDRDYFDLREVRLYYAMALQVLSEMGLFDQARQCLEIIKKISSQKNIIYLESTIDFIQYPRKRWWNFTKAILFILFLLGLVISCIWGIISFFRWLF